MNQMARERWLRTEWRLVVPEEDRGRFGRAFGLVWAALLPASLGRLACSLGFHSWTVSELMVGAVRVTVARKCRWCPRRKNWGLTDQARLEQARKELGREVPTGPLWWWTEA